ncbi:MAG: M28 family peptidase [Saprospiraceae bacterium]|nr:M28 family peptidase [Saprospiraceae bacterium]
MKKTPITPPLFLLCCLLSSTILAQSTPLMGYSEAASQAQIKLEQQFDSHITATNQDQWMKRLAARPHHPGSAYGLENAKFMEAQFRSWGYETRLEEYFVLFPTPKVRKLELVSPTKYTAVLQEPPFKEDATSGQTKEQLPTYNCFSADGDVTAELVFVNYGVPADYEELEKLGIDVKGKIVIAKYGGSWRGIKPKVAAEKGAIGCLIYSDPEGDGYFHGDVYPKGAFKNDQGVQRGSVLDMPIYPGDPLTPGIGATKDAKRLERADATTLMTIPVLPISYGDAKPLLAALSGPVAPESWRGALPITYHIGPGSARVHLKLEFDWKLTPIYNVIAMMKGSEYPDEWVIRGNHHDAWVNGASDPISGMVAVMEEAHAVGELAKTGWRPKRTIVYCGWDAEEPGLLGSTEWAEHHAAELTQKAVAYINTDGNGRGYLFASGSHTFEKFFDQITRAVTDPQTGVSIFDRIKSRYLVDGKAEPKSFKLGALGSGSDYTPFIQHLGIAAFNLGFGGEDDGGEYHTIYDSYDHFTRFKDPGFHYGVALVKVAGRTTLRLANAEYLPLEFQNSAQTIGGYVEDLMKMADNMREQTQKQNRLIREGHYKYAADPTLTFIVPAPKDEVPYFNFAPLQNAMARLKDQANAYEKALSNSKMSKEKAAVLNQLLKNMERALTRSHGLPGRPWFKHHIYAPGQYSGYGVKTLPAVREAIEQRQWDQVQPQIDILAEVLTTLSKEIEKAVLFAR